MKKITKIRNIADNINVYVTDEETETCFTISVDDYADLHLTVDKEISRDEFDKLNVCHTRRYAYNKALKKLETTDRTVKEIRDMLGKIDLSTQDRDQIIQELLDYGYLNDDNVARIAFEFDSDRLIGINKTATNLASRGVQREIINNNRKYADHDSQLQAAVKKSQILLKRANTLSQRETVSKVRNTLYGDGFENEIIEEALAKIDFSKDDSITIEKVFQKALNHYSRKYKGKQLSQKIYQYLYNKGYKSDNINTVLESLGNQDED